MKEYIIVFNDKSKTDMLPSLIRANSYTDAYLNGSLQIPEGAAITAVIEVLGNTNLSEAVTSQKGYTRWISRETD